MKKIDTIYYDILPEIKTIDGQKSLILKGDFNSKFIKLFEKEFKNKFRYLTLFLKTFDKDKNVYMERMKFEKFELGSIIFKVEKENFKDIDSRLKNVRPKFAIPDYYVFQLCN